MDYVVEHERKIPVIGEYDVTVLGGGPAGVSAAISSARMGAKTLLVERYGYTGGQATGGLVILLVGLTNGKNRIIKGNCQEFIDRLESMNGAKDISLHVLFDPEKMKLLFDTLLVESNVETLYHSFAADAICENNKIKAVILAGKSGLQAIKSKIYIDATGDADLAKYCDIPFDHQEREMRLPATLGFRVGGLDITKVREFTNKNAEKYINILKSLDITTRIGGWIHTLNPNEAWFNIATIENIDVTASKELTHAEIEARQLVDKIMKKFKQEIIGFENGYLIDTASQMGVRDSRRIKGLYRFNKSDANKTFEDKICLAPNYTGIGKGHVEVPYRCLLTEHMDNIIFAGRCISVEHEVIDMFREIPCCTATGQAAGVAAYIACSSGKKVRDINIKELQQRLINQGVMLEV